MEWSEVGVEWKWTVWSGVEWSGVEWIRVDWNGMEWNGVEWSGSGVEVEWDWSLVEIVGE